MSFRWNVVMLTLACLPFDRPLLAADHVRELQALAVASKEATWGHWGTNPKNYLGWQTHSNRLIPVYTFGTLGQGPGIDLKSYQGENSPYRNERTLTRIYERTPTNTVNPKAEYFDQTNICDIQKAALGAGKKNVILVIFDGMDWQTTWAASIVRQQKVAYTSGRGTGLHFQDYTAAGTTQFGFMVTSPHDEGTKSDINEQRVVTPGSVFGGYNADRGGSTPWTEGTQPAYLLSRVGEAEKKEFLHAYTDSSSSATSMTAGIKTFNSGVNVDYLGRRVKTVAHIAQEAGYAVGVVTSVPIPHATPAAAYAHNVDRDDYQDLSRDLIGLPSISHPEDPLPGMNVVIGCGYGEKREKDGGGQGKNYVSGNAYLTAEDQKKIDVAYGGKYVVATRSPGSNGRQTLRAAAAKAIAGQHRLLGFYGVSKGHLPFATADGRFDPVDGVRPAEVYKPSDIDENPTLADMTYAAISVLSRSSPKGFWLMVESGDVDWANHDDNIDNSIGAVFSGDAAVRTITDWVEQNSNWNETIVIVTSDHGHMLVLDQPEKLISGSR